MMVKIYENELGWTTDQNRFKKKQKHENEEKLPLETICPNSANIKMASVPYLEQMESWNLYLILSTLKTDLLSEDENRWQCKMAHSFVIILARRGFWYMFTTLVRNLSQIIQFLRSNIARWKQQPFFLTLTIRELRSISSF